jgi:hypothetical protein
MKEAISVASHGLEILGIDKVILERDPHFARRRIQSLVYLDINCGPQYMRHLLTRH